MLTSCVVSTNWLFAAGSVSCYPASMANLLDGAMHMASLQADFSWYFILFTGEKCLLYQH